MDADLLKRCHREIGHIVFDAKEKVTARRISNNWNIDCKKSTEVLSKWIEEQQDKTKLSLEYIVRGVDKTGNVFITLVKEEKLPKMYKLYSKCVQMLYSAEVSSDIRPMNVSLDKEFNVINLRLETQKRQIDQGLSGPVQSQLAMHVKQTQKPPKVNLFSTASKPSVAVKEENSSPPLSSAAVKTERQTASSTKQSPKKDTKKVVNGKGSISSFFSSKPGQKTASNATCTTTAVKVEPESPGSVKPQLKASQSKQLKSVDKPEPVKLEEKTRKRTITDDEGSDEEQDVIPNTPQEVKRESKKRTSKPLLQRKKTANPSKKSRILEICDSTSDDEMDEREATEQKKERLVEFDDEMTEVKGTDKQKCLSPEKPVENDSNTANRSKVKKMVTKTFTDEDGYLITIQDWEMVSEDESEEKGAEKETSVIPAVKTKAAVGSQASEKKETPPTPKTKQGSIMSFFAKK